MIVAFTVSCLRQQYLRDALASWKRARGSDKCRFLFALEPPEGHFPVEEFTAYVKGAFPGGAEVHVAHRHLNCLKNTRRAMALALEREDFAVVAEEDLEVSDDIIEYLRWARDTYRTDQDITTVCAHARSSQLADASAVARAPWFNPLVWGTWRDRWDGFINPLWGPGEPSNVQSWDLNVMRKTKESGHHSLFPARSRVIHFGHSSTLTAWPLSDFFFDKFRSDAFARSYPPQQFHEIEFPEAPGALVV